MYCSKCGKQLSDDSIFCLHCGNKVGSITINQSPFSDLPPKYLHRAKWWYSEPKTKSLFGGVISSYEIGFELLDEDRNPTRWNGTGRVKLLRYNIYASLFKYSTVHQTTFTVTPDKFRKKDSRWFGEWYPFLYNVEKPVLKEDEYYKVEIWFQTPDGQEFYGTDRS